MPKENRAVPIDEAEWEKHRSEIERFFLKEHRTLERSKKKEGRAGVIEHMQNLYGFSAIKSQYEHQFDKWHLRKNLKRKEWSGVISKVDKRARLAKDSNVSLKGEFYSLPITKDRIERERIRYGQGEGEPCGDIEGLSPNIPIDLDIHTPPSACISDHDTIQISQRGIWRSSPSPIPTNEPFSSTTSLVRSASKGFPTFTSQYNSLAAPIELYEPFSWAKTLDWKAISQFITPRQQIVKWTPPTAAQVDTVFYPRPKTCTSIAGYNMDSFIPQLLIFSLINNVDLPNQTHTKTVHKWLREMPRSTVLQLFENLPPPVFDVVRERVFVAALTDGDLGVVEMMTTLGFDLCQKIRDSKTVPGQSAVLRDVTTPLKMALVHGQFSIAKFILSHLCQQKAQLCPCKFLDELLYELLSCYRTQIKTVYEITLWEELMDMLLSAGARPTIQCFMAVESNFNFTKKLVESAEDGFQTWFQAGMLRGCDFTTFEWALSFFEDVRNSQDSWHDSTILAISHCFKFAVKKHFKWIIEPLYAVCKRNGWDLRDGWDGDDLVEAILGACDRQDWRSLYQLTEKSKNRTRSSTPDDSEEMLRLAISENDLENVRDLLDWGISGNRDSWKSLLEQALSLGRDDIATEIFTEIFQSSMGCFTHWSSMTILHHGKTAAMSALLLGKREWSEALDCANIAGGYVLLDDLLYRRQSDLLYDWRIENANIQQIALRAISYHAIHTKNLTMLKWLLKSGLYIEKISCDFSDHDYDRDRGYKCMDSSNFRFFKTSSRVGRLGDKCEPLMPSLPSLLSIAAGQSGRSLIQFLLNEGSECMDTNALERAIRSKADAATISMLLHASSRQVPCKIKLYGSNALREAICLKDYGSMRLLAEKVDINGLDTIVEDNGEPEPLSPLGQAILGCDLEAADILLSKGADPNALVAASGMKRQGSSGAILNRLSPLLAAIDRTDFPMVQLLAKSGADIDHPPRLGLLRTPLQRAAEVGNFEIVQYFLDRGAPADRDPFYGGGTALQLAAMGAHDGVATLLLERGANPNFPPAEGEGRTAFELAAEWGRVDTMSLLVRHGADLNLKFSGETQYQRALKFAEYNGQMASKRFVEHLYRQYESNFVMQTDLWLSSEHMDIDFGTNYEN